MLGTSVAFARRRGTTAAWVVLVSLVLGAARGRAEVATAGPEPNAPIAVNWIYDEPDITLLDNICLSSHPGLCSLRAAVQQANYNPGADTIVLGPGYHFLYLPGAEAAGAAGDLNIFSDITIRGAGMISTTIVMSADIGQRVFEISSKYSLRLEDLGLTGGNSADPGGGIENEGWLILDHTRVFSNEAMYLGGSVGGGIYNSGSLEMHHSVVENNMARGDGGGLFNEGSAWIEGSTFANNSSRDTTGGGIRNASSLTLINSTISGNASDDGGSGLHNAGTGTVNAYNITAALNIHNTDLNASDTNDAGVVNTAGGTLNVRSSIIAGNYELIGGLRYYKDCEGTLGIFAQNYFMPLGFSPSSSAVEPCVFSKGLFGNAHITMRASDLGPLANNGGPTPTHDLDPGSAAYNNAGITGCLDPYGDLLETDQRGTPRIFGGGCDAGAVEHGSFWKVFAPLVTR